MVSVRSPRPPLQDRIVPVPLDLAAPPPDAAALFQHWWRRESGRGLTEHDWLPVGRVGPVVILGHPAPEDAADSPLPLAAFGLTRIPTAVHGRLHAALLARAETRPSTGAESIVAAPAAGASLREVLAAMLTFPGADRDSTAIRHGLAGGTSDEELLASLPPGWREAALALWQQLPLVDLGGFTPRPQVAGLLPEAFAREHDLVAVAVDGATLIAATPNATAGVRANYIQSSWKAAREDAAGGLRLRLALCAANTRQEMDRRLALRAKGGLSAAPWSPPPANRVVASTANIRTKLVLQRKEFERLGIDAPNMDDRTLLRLALYRAIESGASDLHIDVENGAGRLRVRRDGLMRPLGTGRLACPASRP